MKRFFITCLLASPALVATGCPMYDDTGCESELDCGPGYECHLPSGACVREHPDDRVTRCRDLEDCGAGEICDRYGRCVEGGGGGESGAGQGGGDPAGGAGRAGASGETSSSGGGASGEAGSSGGVGGDRNSSGGAAGDAGSSANGGVAAADGGVAGESNAGAGG